MIRYNPATADILRGLSQYRDGHYQGNAKLYYDQEYTIEEVIKPNWCLIPDKDPSARIFVCISNTTRINVVAVCSRGNRKWLNQSFPQLNELIGSAVEYLEGY